MRKPKAEPKPPPLNELQRELVDALRFSRAYATSKWRRGGTRRPRAEKLAMLEVLNFCTERVAHALNMFAISQRLDHKGFIEAATEPVRDEVALLKGEAP